MQFYSYCLAYRPNNKFDPILFCGRLIQQYVIQAYIIIETNRLNFYRYNQKKLRIECYQGIVDHVARSAFNNSNNFNELEFLFYRLHIWGALDICIRIIKMRWQL